MRQISGDDLEGLRGLLVIREQEERIVLVIGSIVMTVLALAFKPSDFPTGLYVFLYALFFAICYYPLTAMAFRYADLNGNFRLIFCVSFVPLFILLLLLATHVLFEYIPGVQESYDEWEAPRRYRNARRAWNQRGGWQMMLAAALAAFAVWSIYRLLRRIGGRREKS